MWSGHKGALKLQDGTWHALSTKVDHIVLSEEAAFKEALLKDVHSFLEDMQEKKISESNVTSFVLDETKRQIAIQETEHINDHLAKDVQDIRSFLAELIQPKRDSYVSVGI
jgi:hypothetical protein